MIVSCDGHIIDAVGPYAATQTDADIVTNSGFRDAIPLLENCNYRIFKPESLDEGASQLTFSQANKSRKATASNDSTSNEQVTPTPTVLTAIEIHQH
uniref:SFRICE_038712 n=1 Tax=Spodoptera frugiperda TaxID=7108 RepID=A0A2H1WGN0_SPOFR